MSLIFRHRNPDGSLDTNTTMKVVAIVMAMIAVLGYYAAMIAAAVVHFFTGKVIEPTARWLDGYDSTLLLLAAMLGIAGGVTWAKRSTYKAEAAEVFARQASGVAATPPAEPGRNLPRNSAPVETVGATITQETSAVADAPPRAYVPTEGDRPKLTDHDIGIL